MDFTIILEHTFSQFQDKNIRLTVRKNLGSLESTQDARVALGAPRATLTPLSCSPNFPRAQYLDIRTLTHELIVK